MTNVDIYRDIEVNKQFISDLVKNKKYNEDVILDYYYRLQSEHPELNLANKINNVYSCNSWWLLDTYKLQGIKDFKKTNLCKDKFCNNCKKVKQASRMGRFIPKIENIKHEYSLYHLTLTLPNCSSYDLSDTIKKISSGFRSLNRYFNGHKSIKGLNLEQYGYGGALRSLEITFKGDSYHPHLHCIIALSKSIVLDKNISNTYSYSYGEHVRSFSVLEILIQKIWFLLMNGKKVTKKSIDELDEGYSCTMDSIDDNSYYEVFKYMTKSTDEDNNILTYENFKTLYFALHRVRQIQGYGEFYNFKDDDIIADEVDDFYDVLVNILKSKEDPEEVSQTPQDLLLDNEYILISRKKIYSYLKNL